MKIINFPRTLESIKKGFPIANNNSSLSFIDVIFLANSIT